MNRLFTLTLIILLSFTGLYSQSIWQQADGPFGGTVYDISKDGSGNLYAATLYAGIFKSTDDGNSWVNINNGLSRTDVFSMAVNGKDHLFAGTKGGIFRSLDEGLSWTEVKTIEIFPGNFADIFSISINQNDDIFAAAYGAGVFRSTDNGNTWQQANSGINTSAVLILNTEIPGYIFVGTENSGIFFSTDNGNSWLEANNGMPSEKTIQSISLSGGNLFAAVDYKGIYKSTDNGNSWNPSNNGLITNTFYDYPLIEEIFSASNGDIFLGSNVDGIFRSADNGENWEKVNDGLDSKIVYSLSENFASQYLAGTSRGGVFISDSSNINWTDSNYGFTAAEIKAIASNSSANLFSAAYGKGILRSSDLGQSWENASNGLTTPFIFTIAASPNGFIYAGGFDGQVSGLNYGFGVLRSSDEGLTWSEANNGITSNWINKISVNNQNNNVFAAAINNSSIFRSTDNGDSWENVLDEKTAHDFAFTENTVLASIVNDGIYKSTDGGTTWNSVNTDLPLGNKVELISAKKSEVSLRKRNLEKNNNYFQTSPDGFESVVSNITSLLACSSEEIYAGSQGSIFKSTDNGETWQDINAYGLPFDWLYDIQKTPEGIMYLRAGSIYRSSDNGLTWENFDKNLEHKSSALHISNSGKILSGTIGNGLFVIEKISFPYTTFWGVDDSESGQLYYYSLAESRQFFNVEGTIVGLNEPKDIEDIAVDSIGNIYFINNTITSRLYKINIEELDKDPSTPVKAVFIGDTKLPAGTSEFEITGLQIYDGIIYGISKLTQKVYEINSENAEVTEIGSLNTDSDFRTDGLAKASDGNWYLLKTFKTNSEIWKFASFPNGPLSLVTQIPLSGKVEALTSHPNGNLYAADDTKFYEIDFANNKIGSLSYDSLDIEGIDFNYHLESQKLIEPIVRFDEIGTITSVQDQSSLIRSYAMEQNYPNPFNPSTTIRFTIANAGQVKLEVFNALGEKITTLIDENLEAGIYEKNFNAFNIPSGVYFYRIDAENFSLTRKMILVK